MKSFEDFKLDLLGLKRYEGLMGAFEYDVRYFKTQGKGEYARLVYIGKDGEMVGIPEGVKYMKEAFERNSIKGLIFPESMHTIGERCFCEVVFSEEIVLPDNIKKIGEYAFTQSKFKKGLVLSNSLEKIETGCFYDTNLETIAIPKTIKRLPAQCFVCCEKLKNIEMPDTIETIGNRCFAGCFSMESIRLPESLEVLGWETFKQCEKLKEIYIPDNVRYIAPQCFSECSSLELISVPERTMLAMDWLAKCDAQVVFRGGA